MGAAPRSGPESAYWAGTARPVSGFLPPFLPGDRGQSWRGSLWGAWSRRATTQVRGCGGELGTRWRPQPPPPRFPSGRSRPPGAIGRAWGPRLHGSYCCSAGVALTESFLLLVPFPQSPSSGPSSWPASASARDGTVAGGYASASARAARPMPPSGLRDQATPSRAARTRSLPSCPVEEGVFPPQGCAPNARGDARR